MTVNGREVCVEEDITVAALLARLGFPDRGLAVALDSAVLPRSQWNRRVAPGVRVEVVTAVQGG